ncbi:MAG: GSCFA domain-containing protein [Prevotellaceae bacterium]|nr:GSCFA domain-containing protein [Prevotellaceae bacterium]
MDFRTQIAVEPMPRRMGYEHKVMLVGSCFAANLAARLQGLKFAAMSNPFGVLYNPVSVAQSLRRMGEKRLLAASDLRYGQGLWFSYTHHSRFAHPDRDECLRRINESILRGAWGLKTADFLVVTLGTSWAYRLKETGEVAACCHKSPDRDFERFFLSPDETAAALCDMVRSVQDKNSGVQVIFTVSPIRHWKDGAHGNQLSKAALLLAVEQALQKTENTAYFPAYEILQDELRDYRFYASDMLHPSEVAVEYIWEKFEQAALSESARQTMAEVKHLLAAKAHRPFNADAPEYRSFLEAQHQNLLQLKQRLPHLDWEDEEAFFAKH